MDSIEIGSSPAEEPCAQVGSDNYYEMAHRECRALIRQLRRKLGQEPPGARLYIKSNPHDFGTYYEVACKFNENDEAATEYAYKCESECPQNWDEKAKEELLDKA
jgi:hypothetical protein